MHFLKKTKLGMGKKDKQQKEDPKETTKSTADQVVADMDKATEKPGADPAQAEQSSVNNAKLETLTKEHNELKDKYLRLRAEFDNFRKRTLKEKLDDRKLAKKDIMTELLPILDDFDRANKVAVDAKTVESISEGMRLVHQKFINTLTLQGLQAIESNEVVFDPEIHEAIAEIPAPTEKLKGKVVDTVEKGYMLNGIIIRHPKVVVGK